MILGLIICFIWGNSLRNGDESSESSNFIVNIIMNIFPNFNRSIISTIVRKTAHFTEYFILGGYMFYLFRKNFLWFICIGISIIDETIQSFIPGRDGRFLDVLIDSLGSLTGIFLVGFVIYYIKRENKEFIDYKI